jgi:UDP-GlcNAc:undecaprenyl-phosphate GlcNAc-1-phosphate transferase
MCYIFFFVLAFLLSFLITFFVRKLALRLEIVDRPEVSGRKIHKEPIPLLGGLAIWVSYFLVILFLVLISEIRLTSNLLSFRIFGDFITFNKLFWLFFGGLFLVIGGYLDDKYNLKARYQIIWALLAALTISFSSIGISHIKNPLPFEIPFLTAKGGEIIRFDILKLGFLTLPQDLFTFVWLLVMMYTTKLLDGLDGLVSGVVSIGSLIIFFVTLLPFVHQYDTAFLAIILVGVFLGFLVWNFHPAKIFLGESGSLLAGYFLGILAIISGSKVATTLLIMGVPILDVFWVVIRRVFFERKSFASADKKHLHFRLLEAGFSHRGAVLFLYAITGVFGLTTLFFQTQQKFIVLIIIVITMIGLGIWVTKRKS